MILTFDMHRVEAKAENCKALIPTIQEFKDREDRFPSDAEATQLDSKLGTECAYYNSDGQFALLLRKAVSERLPIPDCFKGNCRSSFVSIGP